jgi:hypothetical protein
VPSAKQFQFGGLPRRYNFVFNPYPDQRIWRCPFCERKTGQRKVPLLIHVEPRQFIALNYTCRYCSECDLLIANKHEIEHLLTAMLMERDPALIGNDYFVMGTMEKKAWREGQARPKSLEEIRAHIADFKEYYKELRMTQPGWYGPDQEPPVMEPPRSQEWVKSERNRHVSHSIRPLGRKGGPKS